MVEAFQRLSPARRAELFVSLRVPEQKALLAAFPPELAAAVLADCDSASLRRSLCEIDLSAVAAALKLTPPECLANLALRLPRERSEALLETLDPELRESVRKLLTFDPESAGGMMTPRYLSVPEVVSVGHALELLRRSKLGDSPSYIYVVDINGKLVGTVGLRKLLLAEARQPIRPLVQRDVVRVRASASRQELLETFREHRFVSLPVVDDQERLIGIVAFDDVMAAMRAEEERIVRGVTGADPREAFKETVAAARSRIPWITVTILGGLGCAVVGGLFRRTLQEVVVLGIFIPIVLALGESIGAQTTSVVLSSLLGGAWRGRVRALVLKELGIGVLVGLYAAVLVTAASFLWHANPWLGTVIGAAVLLSVGWAALLGVMIPGALVRFRVDPAIASGPLVLAVADLSTLVIYFGGATLLLWRLK